MTSAVPRVIIPRVVIPRVVIPRVVIPRVVIIPDEITCVSFDAGRRGIKATKRAYVLVIHVFRDRSAVVGRAGRFDGTGRLEIPRFTSAYAAWSQFGVSFWYKRDSSGNTGRQELVSNSFNADPSISIGSDPGLINARLVTNGGVAQMYGGVPVR